MTQEVNEKRTMLKRLCWKKNLSSHGMSDNNQNNPCSDINIDKIAIQASSVGYIV